MSLYFTRVFTGYAESVQVQGVGLEGFRIAHDTKTDVKDVFRIHIFTIVITLVLALIFSHTSLYLLGVERAVKSRPIISRWLLSDWREAHKARAFERDYLPWYVAAYIVIPILLYLRMKFPWFMIDPIGLWIASRIVKLATAMWVMWWVKWIIIKVGGEKLYSKGIPIAIGVMVGAFLSKLLMALVLYATGTVAPL